MVITALIPLSLVGGLMAGITHRHWQRPSPPLVTQLLPAVQTPATPPLAQRDHAQPSLQLSTNHHLTLSAGLVGLTTVSRWGLPLLRVISLPGLLYLDLYFVGQAWYRWRATGRVGIETNDAVLATGLLVTRQWGAQALFATFFFTSLKLQEIVAAGVVEETTTTALSPLRAEVVPATPLPDAEATFRWQRQVDRTALPLLALSAVSTPVLGLHRSLSVLLANFGYDYRILAPLSTLNYIKTAKARGIWIRDGRVLEQLHAIDVVLIEGEFGVATIDPQAAQARSAPVLYQAATDAEATVTQIAQWQAEGKRVAYLCTPQSAPTALAQADVVIQYAAATTDQRPDNANVQVLIQPDQPAQLQQLFAPAAANHATHQRGLALALIPSLVNLWGIYLWRFDIIAALLVDYSGMGLGLVNALGPQWSDWRWQYRNSDNPDGAIPIGKE